jgi:hypothetical protein
MKSAKKSLKQEVVNFYNAGVINNVTLWNAMFTKYMRILSAPKISTYMSEILDVLANKEPVATTAEIASVTAASLLCDELGDGELSTYFRIENGIRDPLSMEDCAKHVAVKLLGKSDVQTISAVMTHFLFVEWWDNWIHDDDLFKSEQYNDENQFPQRCLYRV